MASIFLFAIFANNQGKRQDLALLNSVGAGNLKDAFKRRQLPFPCECLMI